MNPLTHQNIQRRYLKLRDTTSSVKGTIRGRPRLFEETVERFKECYKGGKVLRSIFCHSKMTKTKNRSTNTSTLTFCRLLLCFADISAYTFTNISTAIDNCNIFVDLLNFQFIEITYRLAQ